MQDIRNVILPSYKQTSGFSHFVCLHLLCLKSKTHTVRKDFYFKIPKLKDHFPKPSYSSVTHTIWALQFQVIIFLPSSTIWFWISILHTMCWPIIMKIQFFTTLANLSKTSPPFIIIFFSILSRPGKRHLSFPKLLKTHHLSQNVIIPVDVTVREQQEWKWQCYKDNKFLNQRPPSQEVIPV